MSKLVVAGCSFSDAYYARKEGHEIVSRPYGEILSEKIGRAYVHHARTCGSNERIWRVICNDIIDGSITSDDIVLIQYTELTRREFLFTQDPGTKDKHINEPFNDSEDSYLIRFKFGSNDFYTNRKLSTLLDLYENCFIDEEYEANNFEIRNLMFQTLLHYYNINAYFLVLNAYGPNEDKIVKTSLFKDRVYVDREIGYKPEHQYNGSDKFHLSQVGHQQLADDLYHFLSENHEV